MRKEYQTIAYRHPEGRYENRPAGHFEVLTPLRFLYDLHLEVNQAKRRVWAQTMNLYSGYFADAIVSWCEDATLRGLDVRLNIDASSKLGKGANAYYQDRITPTKGAALRLFQQTLDERLFRQLEGKGATLTFTNPPDSIAEHLFPTLVGRDHKKITIVDDVAYIGGLNLADDNLRSADFMVKITDPAMVATLAEIFTQVNERRPTSDYEIPFEDGTKILIDCGKPGESLILDTAAALIDEAQESVRAVTLLAPDGKLRTALRKASNEGVFVEDITSNPERANGIFGLTHLVNLALLRLSRDDIPLRYFLPGDLHAKSLLIDVEDPKRAAAVTGSHNHSGHGVRAGTSEIVIVSRNPRLIKNVWRFYRGLREKTIDANSYSPLPIFGKGNPWSA